MCVATRRPPSAAGRPSPSTGPAGWSSRSTTPPPRPAPTRCAPRSRPCSWPATGSGTRRARTPPGCETVTVVAADADDPGVTAAVRAGQVTAEAVAWARDLINTPSNTKNPGVAGRPGRGAVRRCPARHGPRARPRRTARRRLRRGPRRRRWLSDAAPGDRGRLPPPGRGRRAPGPRRQGHHLRHRRAVDQAHAGMREMKTDMAGGAAVLATLEAVARSRAAGRRDRRRPGGRERRVRLVLPSGRRRPARRRPDDRGAQHRRRGPHGAGRRRWPTPGWSWARPSLVDVATLTGAMKVALGAADRRACTPRPTAWPTRCAPPPRTPVSRCGGCRWPRSTRPARQRGRRRQQRARQPRRRRRPHSSCGRSPASCRGRTSTSPARPAPGSDDAEIVKGGTGFGARTLLRWLEAGAPVDGAPLVEER